jgi:ornithine carbamoyltransferase
LALLTLRHKDLLSIADLDPDEVQLILEAGVVCKAKQKSGELFLPLLGKTLGMIFHKPSARTRLSFEIGMYQLGGQAILTRDEEIGLDKREPVEDVARLFSRYMDGVVIRTFDHDLLIRFAEKANIPVINGLTDFSHPCQILADLMTIREQKKKLKGIKVAFIGDGNNVANSWAYGAGKMGLHLTVASPKGYELLPDVLREAQQYAKESGGSISLSNSPVAAATGADVLYTDVWTSMGQEEERRERLAAFEGFQIGEPLMKKAAPDAIVMHCLPAHRGEEITAETMERFQKVIFDEAENRLHVQKGLMALLMGKPDTFQLKG